MVFELELDSAFRASYLDLVEVINRVPAWRDSGFVTGFAIGTSWSVPCPLIHAFLAVQFLTFAALHQI